jgi:1-acyl-sn-glycerol-3-phosphate acyltransferase
MSEPARQDQLSSSATLGWWVRVGLASALCALYWAVGALAFVLLGAPLSGCLRVETSRRLGQRWLHRALAGFTALLRGLGIVRVRFHGFDRWPAEASGQIMAPTHPAIWDAIFIMGRCPGLTCILKASLLHNPLLRGGARMAQFIPGSPPLELVRKGVAALEGGQNLLLFPEGTRTRRQEVPVNELKGAVGIIALRAQAPIWPVVVRTDSFYLSKGWPIWRLPSAPVNIDITLLEPLLPEGDAHELVQRLEAVYRGALLA